MKKIKHFLALALALILALCLAACGNSNGGNGGNGNNSNYSDDNYNNGNYSDGNNGGNGGSNGGGLLGGLLGGNDDNNGNGGNGNYSDDNGGNGGSNDDWYYSNNNQNALSVDLYKLDDGRVHVVVTDNSGKVLDKASDLNINFWTNRTQADCDTGYISISKDYASMSYYVSSTSHYHNGFSDVAIFDDVAVATFAFEDFEQYYKEGLEYNIYAYGDKLQGSDYGTGKLGAIKSLTASEYADMHYNELLKFKPQTKANDAWTNEFLYSYYDYSSDDYHYEYGIANISVTNKGAVMIDLSKGDNHTYYVLEETKFEQIVYSYGEILEAVAMLPGENENVKLSMTKEVDYAPEYNLYVAGNSSNGYHDQNYDLYPLEKALSEAPSDFKDKDEYGYIEDILNNSSDPVHPKTDNYVITAYSTSNYIYNPDTRVSTEYPCIEISVYEYDKNDLQISYVRKSIYESNDSASALYANNYQGYDYYSLNGNAIYYTDQYSSYASKAERLSNSSCTLYKGQHYAYYYSDYYDLNYMYSSEAYKSNNKYDEESIRTLLTIPEGNHRSTDSKDCTMSTYTDVYSDGLHFSFSAWDSNYDSNYDIYGQPNTTYRNNVATTISYRENYYDNCCVYVDVVTFSATEANATRYTFNVANLDDVQITLDNYQTFTPDNTQSHSFDMTRVKQD